jgi:hypothetical protein
MEVEEDDGFRAAQYQTQGFGESPQLILRLGVFILPLAGAVTGSIGGCGHHRLLAQPGLHQL